LLNSILSFPVTRGIAVQLRSTQSIYAAITRKQHCGTIIK